VAYLHVITVGLKKGFSQSTTQKERKGKYAKSAIKNSL
jgi:hypothetical protein